MTSAPERILPRWHLLSVKYSDSKHRRRLYQEYKWNNTIENGNYLAGNNKKQTTWAIAMHLK